MPERVDLSTYENGYWGYLNDDVKYTISELFTAIQVNDHTPPIISISAGGMSVLGGIEMLGALIATGIQEHADDIAAGVAGVPVNGLYYKADGTVMIRRT